MQAEGLLLHFDRMCKSLGVDERNLVAALNTVPRLCAHLAIQDGCAVELVPQPTVSPKGVTYAFPECFDKFNTIFDELVCILNARHGIVPEECIPCDMVLCDEEIGAKEVDSLHSDLLDVPLLPQDWFSQYIPRPDQVPLKDVITSTSGHKYALIPHLLSPYEEQPQLSRTLVLISTSQYDPIFKGKAASACVIICVQICEYMLRNHDDIVQLSPAELTYTLAGVLKESVEASSRKYGPLTSALLKQPGAHLGLLETTSCSQHLGFDCDIGKSAVCGSSVQAGSKFKGILEHGDGVRVYVLLSKRYGFTVVHRSLSSVESFYIADSHGKSWAPMTTAGGRSGWVLYATNWDEFVASIGDLIGEDTEACIEQIVLGKTSTDLQGGLNNDNVDRWTQESKGTKCLRAAPRSLDGRKDCAGDGLSGGQVELRLVLRDHCCRASVDAATLGDPAECVVVADASGAFTALQMPANEHPVTSERNMVALGSFYTGDACVRMLHGNLKGAEARPSAGSLWGQMRQALYAGTVLGGLIGFTYVSGPDAKVIRGVEVAMAALVASNGLLPAAAPRGLADSPDDEQMAGDVGAAAAGGGVSLPLSLGSTPLAYRREEHKRHSWSHFGRYALHGSDGLRRRRLGTANDEDLGYAHRIIESEEAVVHTPELHSYLKLHTDNAIEGLTVGDGARDVGYLVDGSFAGMFLRLPWQEKQRIVSASSLGSVQAVEGVLARVRSQVY